jgi:hypothetical protein
MRFEAEEIVLYGIANAIRCLRDADDNRYMFQFGTTDESEHWMSAYRVSNDMFGSQRAAYLGSLRGTLLKSNTGMFSRLNFHQTAFDRADRLEDLYKKTKTSQKSFWPLVMAAFEFNKHQIDFLATQISRGYILDLSYTMEPYIEFSPEGFDRAADFFVHTSVPQNSGNVTYFSSG